MAEGAAATPLDNVTSSSSRGSSSRAVFSCSTVLMGAVCSPASSLHNVGSDREYIFLMISYTVLLIGKFLLELSSLTYAEC